MARGRPKGSGKKKVSQEVIDAVGADVINDVTTFVMGNNIANVEEEYLVAANELGDTIENKIVGINTFTDWDVKRGDPISYFDSDLSYEISGYRPITETQGLDFNPEWFTEARATKLRTGKYCADRINGKGYRDFWTEEIARCKYGYTSHGYTLSGDNYFFLNYYRLQDISGVEIAGEGRQSAFPSFYSKQYEYFHYINICERLKKDVCALKARGVKSCPIIHERYN